MPPRLCSLAMRGVSEAVVRSALRLGEVRTAGAEEPACWFFWRMPPSMMNSGSPPPDR